MRTFVLDRNHDVSGVSGVGIVAEGVQFSDGAVVIRWLGDDPSTVVWPGIEPAMRIHSHGGATKLVWKS